jgi:hypothetical protein
MQPRVFIGSSSEDLLVASVLSKHLGKDAEAVVWTEDVFSLSKGSLSGLSKIFESADFAVFIAPQRGKTRDGASPRSNFLVELGMAVGHLGSERTAILVHGRVTSLRLPSDLEGLTTYEYRRTEDLGSLEKRVESAARRLKRWIRTLGHRPDRSEVQALPQDLVPESRKRRGGGKRRTMPVTESPSNRSTVFISYAHTDAKWLARIHTMLTPLIRANQMSVWDDTKIKPGSKWKAEIRRAITSARVALLLVSSAFLASPFIADEELPPVLNAARDEGLVIVWALVSACLWQKTPIAEYQAAHPIAKSLESLSPAKRNETLLAIAETVGAALSPPSAGA